MILFFFVILLVLLLFYYLNKFINIEPFLTPEKSKEIYNKHIDQLKGNITYSDFYKDIDYFNQTTEVIQNNRTIEL